jgi:hypothetical protein
MTRKDFRLIAETIRLLPSFEMRNGNDKPIDVIRFDALVNRTAESLRTTNPRFKTERFVSACKGKER